ncbi:MAG: ABC-type transport auxiliary lipoprotein family protein [Pseudomonadota bacterium]
MRPSLALWSALLLAGCTLLPGPPPARILHDLGAAPPARAALPWPLEVRATAPAWLDDGGVHYRPAGAATRLAVYRDHYWAAPPSALLAQRLRDLLAPPPAGAPARWLEVEITAFEQRFAAPAGAEARIAARALLRERRGGTLLASRDFALALPAGAEVDGGVAALAAAMDALAGELLDWLAAEAGRRP